MVTAETERELRALRRENEELRQQREVLKGVRHLLGDPALKMALVAQLVGEFPVRLLAAPWVSAGWATSSRFTGWCAPAWRLATTRARTSTTLVASRRPVYSSQSLT